MSDSTVARILGSVLSIAGLAGGWVAWANEWTLFVPFAAVLVALGIWCQFVSWSWQRR